MRRDEFLAAVEADASSPGDSGRPGRRDRNGRPAGAWSRRPPAARCESPCAAGRNPSAPSRNSLPVRSICRRIWCSAPRMPASQASSPLIDGEPQRLDLDHGAHPRDVEQILAADFGDPKTALSDADDQAARDQPRQSLAQRRRADLVALRRDRRCRAARPAPGGRRECRARPASPRVRSACRLRCQADRRLRSRRRHRDVLSSGPAC